MGQIKFEVGQLYNIRDEYSMITGIFIGIYQVGEYSEPMPLFRIAHEPGKRTCFYNYCAARPETHSIYDGKEFRTNIVLECKLLGNKPNELYPFGNKPSEIEPKITLF